MALTKVKASNITLSTPAASSNDTTPATTAYVTTALANLVDSAPSTLNTLNELAAALGDDANFSTTVTNSIAAKAPLASPTFTSNINGGDGVELRLGDSQDILFKHHAGGYGHLENKTGTLYMDSETFTIRTDTDDLGTALFIDASQKVGIGMNSPVSKVHIQGPSASTYTGGGPSDVLRVSSSSAGAWIATDFDGMFGYMGLDDSTTAKFAAYNYATSTEGNIILGQSRMYIKNNGNVGIGETSPSGKLHVSGHTSSIASIFEGNGNGDTVPVQLKVKANNGTTSTQGLYGNAGSASGDNTICLGTSGTSGVIVDNVGKTGINTTPDTLLHLKDTGGIELRLEADSNNSGQEDCFIRFYTDGKTQEGLAGMDNNNSSTLFGSNTENAMVFGTVSNLPTLFATNNTERMKINAGGDIEVAAASGSEFKVNSTGSGGNDVGLSTQLPGYAANLYSNFFSSGNNIYFVLGGSYVGYIASNGSYNASDERLKENITDLTGSLDKIKQLRGVNFTWKDSNRGVGNNIGFIAQEVESIIPEVVDDGGLPSTDDGESPMKHVSYEHVVPHLVEAIKELEARVKELEG